MLNSDISTLEPEFYGAPIFPSQTLFAEGKIGFDDATLADIKASRQFAIVIGKVFYDDIFGEHHVTQFCRVWVLTTGSDRDQPGDMITCLSVPDEAN